MPLKGQQTAKIKAQQKAFAKEYVRNSFNATRAMGIVKPAIKKTTARQQGYEMLKENGTMDIIAEEMEKQGMSNEYLSGIVKEGLGAKRVIARNNVSTKQIDIIETNIKDYNVVHKYLTTALELKGLLGGQQRGNTTPLLLYIDNRKRE